MFFFQNVYFFSKEDKMLIITKKIYFLF